MRGPALVLIAVVAGLGGCDKLDTLDVDAHSDREVMVHLGARRCLDRLEIGTPAVDRTILWQIERQTRSSAACPSEITFPHAPPGYRVTVSADRLPEGSFAISGMAQDHAITGHFDIPPR